MARKFTVPDYGTVLFKICPKCNQKHTKCDNNCNWSEVIGPCNVGLVKNDYIIVEKKFTNSWSLRDLKMLDELYFTSKEDAEREIERKKAKQTVVW